MTDLMIEAKGLTRHYKKLEAVRGIDLQVRRGEIFGLVGPDGAGKTTTIQMLTGILTPTAGEARVAGVDVVHQADQLGGKIGYMSEGFTLYGSLSVEENLDYFADLYGVPVDERAARKERLLQFARMAEARNRRAEHLSGGMKKKLALACALLFSPQVLFLDEPTTGVDPVSRRDFWQILYEFLAEGITIFVSTPYMDEAERCHRVALMRRGEIIATDTPAALKSRLRGVAVDLVAHPQTRAVSLLRDMPGVSQAQVFGERLHLLLRDNAGEMDGSFEPATGEPAEPATGETAEPQGRPLGFAQDRSFDVVQDWLTARLARGGVVVSDLQQTAPSLEDVFIAVIEDLRAADQVRRPPIPLPANGDRPIGDGDYAVTVEGLTKRFGNFTAVDRLSFQVRRGDIFGFLGPNGSGKTTTIRMLCGLLPPSDGSGSVAGLDIRRQQMKIKPRIGYMSQKFSLYPDLTVGENLNFYGDVYNVPRKRLADRRAWVLSMAGLTGKEKMLTRDLAGGWKQRLALGCAILHEPEILFLDEPTSGVDPVSRREFWELIFALSAQGVTIFVTTHYMDEAEHCHDLGLIYRGRLIARGSPAQLRAGMKMGELLEIETDRPSQGLPLVTALPDTLSAAVFGDRLHVLVMDADVAASPIEQALRAGGLVVKSVRPVPMSLEDLFITFIEMEEKGRQARGEVRQ